MVLRRLNERFYNGDDSPSFADFSSYREMLREEWDAARAKREAAFAAARTESQASAAERRRRLEEVFGLRLQFALRTRQSGSAVPSSAAARGGCTTNFGMQHWGPF